MTTAVFSAPKTEPPSLGHAVPVAALDGLDRDAWLAERDRGVGGSDAASACGVNRWKGRWELWTEKTGLVTRSDADTERMLWGRILEEPIARELERRIPGLTLFRVGQILAHPERRWQIANVDYGGLLDGETIVVEIKNVGSGSEPFWAHGDIPTHILLQVMHYLAVTGLRRAIIGVLFGGCRLETREVHADDELIADLVRAETEFWEHVTDKSPPAPDGTRAETEFLAHLWSPERDSTVVLDGEMVRSLLAERKDVIDTERLAGNRRAEIENQLKVLMGDHEIAVDDEGRKLCSWKRQERRTIATSELRRAMYDVAAELEVVNEVRILRVEKGMAA